MTTYANGQIPLSALTKLSTVGYLQKKHATIYELLRIGAYFAQNKWRLVPTDAVSAYRNREVQDRIFHERYDVRLFGSGPYGDVRWFKGSRYVRMRGASAATPGTSNHGRGTTIDISNIGGFEGVRYKWLASVSGWYGLNNVEGRSVKEPWHWTMTPESSKALSYAGKYHVIKRTQTYTQTGAKFKARDLNFNVTLIGAFVWDGSVWGVTKAFNLYRMSHLKKGSYVAPVKKETPGWFTVNVSALNGRSSTNTSSSKNIKFTRPRGFEIYAAKVVKDSKGGEWLLTNHGTYYLKKHTKAGKK